jgi:hypothetical protein
LLLVIVAIVIAQLVGSGGLVPTAIGAVLPLPLLVCTLIVAGRATRPPMVAPQVYQAITMVVAFAIIYLYQAGDTWVLTVAFMAGAMLGVGFIISLPYLRWQLKRHPWLIHDDPRTYGATLIRPGGD